MFTCKSESCKSITMLANHAERNRNRHALKKLENRLKQTKPLKRVSSSSHIKKRAEINNKDQEKQSEITKMIAQNSNMCPKKCPERFRTIKVTRALPSTQEGADCKQYADKPGACKSNEEALEGHLVAKNLPISATRKAEDPALKGQECESRNNGEQDKEVSKPIPLDMHPDPALAKKQQEVPITMSHQNSENSPRPESTTKDQRKVHKSKFINATFYMVSLCSQDHLDVAEFLPSGGLIVKDKTSFSKMLPQFFKHSKFASFQRGLTYYGFSKAKSNSLPATKYPSNWHIFQHKLFRCNRFDLIETITIKRISKKEDMITDSTSNSDTDSETAMNYPEIGKKVSSKDQEATVGHLTNLINHCRMENKRESDQESQKTDTPIHLRKKRSCFMEQDETDTSEHLSSQNNLSEDRHTQKRARVPYIPMLPTLTTNETVCDFDDDMVFAPVTEPLKYTLPMAFFESSLMNAGQTEKLAYESQTSYDSIESYDSFDEAAAYDKHSLTFMDEDEDDFYNFGGPPPTPVTDSDGSYHSILGGSLGLFMESSLFSDEPKPVRALEELLE